MKYHYNKTASWQLPDNQAQLLLSRFCKLFLHEAIFRLLTLLDSMFTGIVIQDASDAKIKITSISTYMEAPTSLDATGAMRPACSHIRDLMNQEYRMYSRREVFLQTQNCKALDSPAFLFLCHFFSRIFSMESLIYIENGCKLQTLKSLYEVSRLQTSTHLTLRLRI